MLRHPLAALALVLASTTASLARADEPASRWSLLPSIEVGAPYSSGIHVDRGEQIGMRIGPAIRLLSPVGVGLYARGIASVSFSLRDPANETRASGAPCLGLSCLGSIDLDLLTGLGGDVGVFYRAVLVPGSDAQLAAIVEVGGSGLWIGSSLESYRSHAAAGVVAGALLELALESDLAIAIGLDVRVMVPVGDELGGVWSVITPMLRLSRRYEL